MILLRILLFPFAILYGLITSIRNRLYNLGLKPSARFDIPVISVGNLAVGGTGKSPMVEHLIRLFASYYKLVTLSRGYGRKTKGMRVAGPSEDASTVGDEPFQFYRKFGSTIRVTVAEDRAYAIPNILDQFPETEIILMDDAYQHRRVKPSMSILLTEYANPFYTDFILPAGKLRESRNGAHRADVIVITKCPAEISIDEMMDIEKSVRQYAMKPIFFTKIHYGNPQPFGGHTSEFNENIVLVSGIANPAPLEEYVRKNFKLVKHITFPDHHFYSVSDLNKVLREVQATPGARVLTTEKDMVKIDTAAFTEITSQIPFFYLPIEVEFIKNGRDFDALVQTVLKRG